MPQVRDWNDRLLLEAFGRAYRCLRSIRELAGRHEGEDAAVLTRALVALTLRYLWLAVVEEEDERRDRLRRLLRGWANSNVTIVDELIDLNHLAEDEQLRRTVAVHRQKADEFAQQGVGKVPDDRAIAIALDRYLKPEHQPRFFELIYARIYRATSEVAHYGVGAAIAHYPRDPGDPGRLSLERGNDQQAAQMLGLALITYTAFLAYAEPIVRHGLTDEAAGVIGTLQPSEPSGPTQD
jgi:hypothetical protein